MSDYPYFSSETDAVVLANYGIATEYFGEGHARAEGIVRSRRCNPFNARYNKYEFKLCIDLHRAPGTTLLTNVVASTLDLARLELIAKDVIKRRAALAKHRDLGPGPVITAALGSEQYKLELSAIDCCSIHGENYRWTTGEVIDEQARSNFKGSTFIVTFVTKLCTDGDASTTTTATTTTTTMPLNSSKVSEGMTGAPSAATMPNTPLEAGDTGQYMDGMRLNTNRMPRTGILPNYTGMMGQNAFWGSDGAVPAAALWNQGRTRPESTSFNSNINNVGYSMCYNPNASNAGETTYFNVNNHIAGMPFNPSSNEPSSAPYGTNGIGAGRNVFFNPTANAPSDPTSYPSNNATPGGMCYSSTSSSTPASTHYSSASIEREGRMSNSTTSNEMSEIECCNIASAVAIQVLCAEEENTLVPSDLCYELHCSGATDGTCFSPSNNGTLDSMCTWPMSATPGSLQSRSEQVSQAVPYPIGTGPQAPEHMDADSPNATSAALSDESGVATPEGVLSSLGDELDMMSDD